MASLVHSIANGSRKADGSTNAAGRVWLYSPGTSSTVIAYSDRDKTAPVQHPSGYYPLDPSGRAFLWVDQPCEVREETSDGTLIAQYRAGTDVNAKLVEVLNAGFTGTTSTGQQVAGQRTYLDTILSALYASHGGPDGKYLAASNAAAMLLKDWMTGLVVEVKAFGAKGDGVTDDTLAIQAAVNFAASLNGGVVFFAAGTYKISAAIVCTVAGVDLIGASETSVTIDQTLTTADAFTFNIGSVSVALTGATYFTNRVAHMFIRMDSTSTTTGAAVSTAGSGSVRVDRVIVKSGGFRYALNHTGTGTYVGVHSCSLGANSADASSIGIRLAANAGIVEVFDSIVNNAATAGVQVSGVSITALFVDGNRIDGSGAAAGVGLLFNPTSGTLYLGRNSLTGGASGSGLNIGSSVTDVIGQEGVIASPSIVDARTGAPVGFTFAVNGNFTPEPMRSKAIRVVGTAGGITITANAIAVTGFSYKFTLICSNTSGAGVTWAFNAQYVLSAAVAPATGNRVNLLLEYNPIDNKVYEIGRAATAN
jgi:hypothetical protein